MYICGMENATTTTRKTILAELGKIEFALKSIYTKVSADNNGNCERTEDVERLTLREDELMQELQQFPI
tara:strand:- start:1894 stop:2100 length:207 start_codon:yes stop_codon:yes gene_type:complete